MLPLNKPINLSSIPNQGRFGGVRKYDIHTGVDLYCDQNDLVYAIESGFVVGINWFTRLNAGSPWWNDTKCVLVSGKSGVILYGEVNPTVTVGDYITEGSIIGNVLTVLRKDKGLPMTMLHIELYKHEYRGEGEWWEVERPPMLLNIEDLLLKL